MMDCIINNSIRIIYGIKMRMLKKDRQTSRSSLNIGKNSKNTLRKRNASNAGRDDWKWNQVKKLADKKCENSQEGQKETQDTINKKDEEWSYQTGERREEWRWERQGDGDVPYEVLKGSGCDLETWRGWMIENSLKEYKQYRWIRVQGWVHLRGKGLKE